MFWHPNSLERCVTSTRHLLTGLCVCLGLGCASKERVAAPSEVRSDSVDVTRVDVVGGKLRDDFPQTAHAIVRDEDGTPYVFTASTPQWIRGYEDSLLFVLDVEGARVLEFSKNGDLVRAIGRRGRGPGELTSPVTLLLYGDTLAVFDSGRRIVHRWGALGRDPLGQIGLEGPSPPFNPVAARGSSLLYVRESATSNGPEMQLRWSESDTAMFHRRIAPAIAANLPCGSGLPPIRLTRVFAPRTYVATAGPVIVVSAGTAAYEFWVFGSPLGHLRVRREVSLRRPSAAEVRERVGRGTRLSLPATGTSCGLGPQEIIDLAGVADTLPAIHGLSVTPDGFIWISRTTQPGGEPGAIDEFDARGSYVQTWSNALLPLASLGARRYVVASRDDSSGGIVLSVVDVPR